jgi:hypothetical protein
VLLGLADIRESSYGIEASPYLLDDLLRLAFLLQSLLLGLSQHMSENKSPQRTTDLLQVRGILFERLQVLLLPLLVLLEQLLVALTEYGRSVCRSSYAREADSWPPSAPPWSVRRSG